MSIGETRKTQPLLHWLLRKYPDTPKSRAKQWIMAGRVSVDGMILRQPHQLLPDPERGLKLLDKQAINVVSGADWAIHPRVTLLFLDWSLAIINKGAGLISVPGPGAELSALSILGDYLSGKLKPRDRSIAMRSLPPAFRRLEPLPVHRLDQHTSGVFCAALNPTAREHLIEQVKGRRMGREYVAFVEGRPATSKGTWRDWLQLTKDGMRQNVLAESRAKEALARQGENVPDICEAITHYETVAEYPIGDGKEWASKLRLTLDTGLKHQIRVQAAHAGLPLIGDRRYNPKYREEFGSGKRIECSRQALHAEVLSLEHPEQGGKRMSWRAELPKDLRQLEALLEQGGAARQAQGSCNR